MKHFKINLNSKELEMIIETFKEDLTELILDENELLFRCSVVPTYRKGEKTISFDMTEEQAYIAMQTLLVYSKRCAEAGDDRQFPFFDFALQMLTSFTGKEENDF